ncbi:MAG: hypothetical protein NZ651_05800 [Candidatus Bipolaricaulota bacterium]|nr:hypothetical protein [Candidatus Bipolaricaulota bacterium]MDW8127267.1 hypothetical protein [Candidatus Bipolaricaulota bacterium]
MGRYFGVWLVISVFISLTAFSQQGAEYYLTGNFKEIFGTVVTDKGEQRGEFFGTIGFRVVPGEKGLALYLVEFNLVSKGVPTEKGDSGLLSLRLFDLFEKPLSYDPRSGRASAEFQMVLHYELIDRVKGFRRAEGKGELDLFPSFTEEMKGKASIRFPEALQVAETGGTTADLDLTLELSTAVLGSIRKISLVGRVRVDWTRLRQPAQVLKIQPVFIGTGPTDPNRTGVAFNTLMTRASELWSRCGTVRCLKFEVNNPIYLNKPAYKVLESETEAASLRAEVSVADAVEIFVVERMTFACSWGGGACFSAGTASAKIVTCDQQLNVPAPCPCPSFCPATCPPCPPCQTGAVNSYHLAHELGHALNLDHPGQPYGLAAVTVGSNMEPSGFCCDNPNVQSAKNCRNASNPLLYWGTALCFGRPDIMD